MAQDFPLRDRSSRITRTLGVCATLSLPALWASGILGDALSWQVTTALTVTLALLCLVIPSARLEATVKILVIIASSSIALCIADTALRLFAGKLVYYRAHSELLRRDVRHPGLSHYLPDTLSDRDTFGDLAAMSGDPSHRIHRREVFQTDARGFRNTTRPGHTQFDLIVLGDSFGMGLGSTQEKTWTSILKRQGHSLYNLSMPATCAAHGAARVALELPTLPLTQDATIVVPVYVGNDLEECSEETDRVLAERATSGIDTARIAVEDYRSRSPLRQFGMRLVYRWLFADPVVTSRQLSDGRPVLFYKPHVRAAQLSASEVERSRNFSVMTRALQEIQTVANHHHGSMLVVILPTKEEIYGGILRGESNPTAPQGSSGLATALQAFCATHHMRCVDLTPQLFEAAHTAFTRGDLLWWTDDSHWNHEGHTVAARLIGQALKTQ